MANAVEKIQSEHRDYARVLSCLLATMDKIIGDDARRLTLRNFQLNANVVHNLDLLFSIVYYIRVFPDQFHHPKEERYLFKVVRHRSPETGGILDELVRQHATGVHQIDELDVALKAYEKNYPAGLEDLAAKAESFVALQREHMSLEEEKVIPVAKAVLTEDDWREIDNAFDGNSDPLFGENLETGFHSLHDHIVSGVDTH